MTIKRPLFIGVGLALLLGGCTSSGLSTPASPTPLSQQLPNSSGAKAMDVESLQIEDLQVGTGAEVKSGDTVVMHYRGTLLDGTPFDNSYDRGRPFETQIGVGQVIQGWDEGVPGMKVGGKRKLTIPSSMGYGPMGIPGAIPGGAALVFEVELVDIK